jgi:hypothetical protein
VHSSGNNNSADEGLNEECDEYIAYLVNKTDVLSIICGNDDDNIVSTLSQTEINNTQNSSIINLCSVGKPHESYVLCIFSNGKIVRYSSDLKKVIETLDLISSEVI